MSFTQRMRARNLTPVGLGGTRAPAAVGVGPGVVAGVATVVATGVGVVTSAGVGLTMEWADGTCDGSGPARVGAVGWRPALHAARITLRVATTVACLADTACPPLPDAPMQTCDDGSVLLPLCPSTDGNAMPRDLWV